MRSPHGLWSVIRATNDDDNNQESVNILIEVPLWPGGNATRNIFVIIYIDRISASSSSASFDLPTRRPRLADDDDDSARSL